MSQSANGAGWRLELGDAVLRGVDTVERALVILGAFTPPQPVLTLRELALTTALNKATILRIIVSLERFGYISRLGAGHYALGPATLQLANTYQQTFNLGSLAPPVLRALVKETAETAAFFIRHGNKRLCLFMSESTSTLRSHLREGDVHPLRASGSGKVLQAFAGEKGRELDAVRQSYIAFNNGERDAEIASIAAPVFKIRQELVGAITISGPISHFTEMQVSIWTAIVLRAAARLTGELGGNPEPLERCAVLAPTADHPFRRHLPPQRPEAAATARRPRS
jgi:DNA-binding IclR family transcriptional regulator